MYNIKGKCIFTLLCVFLFNCKKVDKENQFIDSFHKYTFAKKHNPDSKWDFTTDTVKLWFDNKNGSPILQIKGEKSTSPWKGWDEEMHSNTDYDSIWFDYNENAIKGYFYENNDFYKLIGKPPTKTLRTYWLNNKNKIEEILMYWIPEENKTTNEYLKPIVDWALTNYPHEIKNIYPDNKIKPSKENAKTWRKIIEKYKESSN